MEDAGAVDVTLVLAPEEMERFYAAMPYEHMTLAQIVQWYACHALAYWDTAHGHIYEAHMMVAAATRTTQDAWAQGLQEMVP